MRVSSSRMSTALVGRMCRRRCWHLLRSWVTQEAWGRAYGDPSPGRIDSGDSGQQAVESRKLRK